MTTVLRASGSAELLSIVPPLAGFTPSESLVLLPFHGSRTAGAMRLDLPRGDVSATEYADIAVALVARVDRTDAVALVVYTDDEAQATPDGLVLPYAVEIDGVLGCASDAGLGIVDALCVTPSGWSSYLVDDPVLEPLGTAAPDVPSIGDVRGDQHAGTALPVVDFAEKERVGRAQRALEGLLEHGRHGDPTGVENPVAIAALVLLEDIPAFFESVLRSSEALPPFATAALLWCLDRPLFRDVAAVQWATDLGGGMRTLEAQLAFAEHGRPVPDEIGDLLLGRGPRPDPDRLTRALSVVRAAAARAPRASQAAPLTIAAWLSWALGRSSHAGDYLDAARAIDPDYGLAALFEQMISAAILPDWAFRPGGPTSPGGRGSSRGSRGR